MFIFTSLSLLAWNRVLGSWRRIPNLNSTTSVLKATILLLLASGLKDHYDTNNKKGNGCLLDSCMAKYRPNYCPIESSLLGVLRTPSSHLNFAREQQDRFIRSFLPSWLA